MVIKESSKSDKFQRVESGDSKNIQTSLQSPFHRHTSCCWSSAIKLYGSSTLNQDVVISFIKDKRNYFNSPVQLKFIPREKVARNERKTIRIPVYDVDNDFVSCRWAVNYAEGGGIYGVRVGKLSQVRYCIIYQLKFAFQVYGFRIHFLAFY